MYAQSLQSNVSGAERIISRTQWTKNLEKVCFFLHLGWFECNTDKYLKIHSLKVKPQIKDGPTVNTRHHANVRPITAKQHVSCRTYSFGGTLDKKPGNRLVLIDLCAILCHNTTNTTCNYTQ